MTQYSHSNSSQQNQMESEEPDLPELNAPFKIQAINVQVSEESDLPVMNNTNYTRISKKQELLDLDAIVNLYEQNSIGKTAKKQASFTSKKVPKKASKIGALTSKTASGFDYLKKKYEDQFDEIIQKYKRYLADFAKQVDLRQKQIYFELFRYLTFGIFELKQYHQKPNHDMTKNEVKIINPQTDIYQWIKAIVQQFQREFKSTEARKINIREKWDQLVKNCRDESNFSLRRRIIRKKVTPAQVLQQPQSFLLSDEARKIKEREMRLILAEAEQDLAEQAQYPMQQEDEDPANEWSDLSPTAYEPQLTPHHSSVRQINQHEDDLRKLNQYKVFLQKESLHRIKNRIIDDLNGHDSFGLIMADFNDKFGKK